MEESWLSSLDAPCPSERPSPSDRIHTTHGVAIYSGGFNDSAEDLLSSLNPSVHTVTDRTTPIPLFRHPSDPSFSSTWDDSLSSFTAESESDFHSVTSPTWSSFSRRSSGQDNASSIFDPPSRPYSFVGALDVPHQGVDLPSSNSHSFVLQLSDDDLESSSLPDGDQTSTPFVLSAPVDFRPGTSAETIRPSPSQFMEPRFAERLSSADHSSQGSRSSSPSSSGISPSDSGPVTPEPSECSYFSEEDSDEDCIAYDQDIESEDELVGNSEDDHQDASEVETVCDQHGPVVAGSCDDNVKGGLPSASSEQPEDGEGSSNGQYGSGRYTGTSPNAYGYGSLGSRSPGTRGSGGGASGSGGGRDGDGRRPLRPSMPLYDTEEDEDSDSTDDYGEDEYPTTSRQPKAPPKKRSSDEDNVPLARSIPTALKAQKSIRKQVKEESAQRRQERAMRLQAKIKNVSGAPHSAGPATGTFQYEQRSPRIPVRTQTLPLPMASPHSPFPVDDLTKKLMDVQASVTGPNNQELHRSGTRTSHQHNQEPGPSSKSRRPSQDIPRSPPPPLYPVHETFQKPTLRPMRSFHRPTKALQQDTREPLPPLELASPVATRSRSVRRPQTGDPTTEQAVAPAFSNLPLRRSRSTRLQNQAKPVDDDYNSLPRPSSSRPSAEVTAESRTHWSEKPTVLPPVPPVPMHDLLTKQKPGEAWQQKVFIGDLQRSTLVELCSTTIAQDVIDVIESRGELGPHDPGNGGGKGWMLFELAQDFGMGALFFF